MRKKTNRLTATCVDEVDGIMTDGSPFDSPSVAITVGADEGCIKGSKLIMRDN